MTVVGALVDGEKVVAKTFYYPILPGQRPTNDTAQIGNFHVLVSTTSQRKIDSKDGDIEGVMQTGILSLDSTTQAELKRIFPQLETDKVILFRKGGPPSTSFIPWAWLVFGVVILLAGIGSFFTRE